MNNIRVGRLEKKDDIILLRFVYLQTYQAGIWPNLQDVDTLYLSTFLNYEHVYKKHYRQKYASQERQMLEYIVV